MTSGKTHDAITILFVAPIFEAAGRITENTAISTSVTIAFLFGGLMFGPDLDTMSKQYTRWGVFRFLWFPYQSFFAHRSRWSHGLVFGTFLRVVYFMGVSTLTAFAAVFIYASYYGGNLPDLLEMAKTWEDAGAMVRKNIGEFLLPSVFVGLWAGAASHTLTDMAGTFVRTGTITEFL